MYTREYKEAKEALKTLIFKSKDQHWKQFVRKSMKINIYGVVAIK